MKDKIREFVTKNFFGGRGPINDSTQLFTGGHIDSLGHLKLVAFLEREFGVSLSMDDLNLENFDSVEKIATMVTAKLQS